MPGAVVTAGLVGEILPLDKIAPALLSRVKIGRSAAAVR
jgi:two-component system, chemotaxis family, protein-glutamate methylesterase/glutaminase